MESGGHHAALLHQSWLSGVFSQDFDSGSDRVDDGSSDEDHFEWLGLELARREENVAGELAAVGVAQNGHVEQAERVLLRIPDLVGKEDSPGAGSEDRVA